jgi:hypothetical protein
MKMKELLHDWTQPVLRTELPRESSGAQGPKDWTDVGILQLANFFLKCWLANLLIALVLGIIGFAAWAFFLRGLIRQ